MSLYTVCGPIALQDILVLLLSSNAIANNTLFHLLSLRVSIDSSWNPLVSIISRDASSLLTSNIMKETSASQVKETVELRMVLTDWGWTRISI